MNEEEEIIKSGLKSHSKQDTMCYLGMALIGILIFIPPLFRIIFADSIPKSTIEEITYMTVSCRTGFFDEDGLSVIEVITSNYRQSEILDMKVEFIYDNENPKFNESQVLSFMEIWFDAELFDSLIELVISLLEMLLLFWVLFLFPFI